MPPDLAGGDIERILKRGLELLRARRKVRVLVPPGRRAALALERPHLMKAVDAQPDVLVEEANDVGHGFARVVTEVGGALCAEDSAMEALAQAVNVKEAPRARHEGGGSGATHVGPSPLRRGGMAAPTADLEGDLDHGDDDDEARAFRASLEGDDDPDRSEIVARPDLDELSSLADVESLPSIPDLDALPDAVIDEDMDEDEDRTRALPARVPRPGQPRATPAPVEPPSSGPAAKRPAIIKGGGATPTAGRRGPAAATRVLALDAQAELRDQAKRGERRVDLGADDDDDLDLYTDRRPGRR
jgi:hypothetical protein